MSVNQVCAILKASVQAGVTELEFRDLRVKFGRPAERVENVSPLVQHTYAPATVADLTEEQHAAIGKAALEEDEVLTREERLARALVERPELYEELLRDGELSDELDTADDGDDSE